MKLGILSDTHIGKSLKTNTTIESRARLKKEIFDTAGYGVELLRQEGADIVIHTADLFDKAVNDEADILDGSLLAGQCDVVMFGNHDDRNRKDTVSSIGLLAAVASGGKSDSWFIPTQWEASFRHENCSGANLYFIPHCVSQQVFEESLLSAARQASHASNNYLFLHCNYDNDLVTEKEQNLNLTEEMADRLLEDFDFIVMGHEHQLAKRKDGRVISVGPTHPTSFSDISDKFVTIIDTETKEVEHHLTWSSKRAWTVDVEDFVRLTDLADSNVQFIDVVGKADAKVSVEVADTIAKVWKEAEHLIALRTSKIEYIHEAGTAEEEVNLESLPEVMLAELEGETADLLREALSSVESK